MNEFNRAKEYVSSRLSEKRLSHVFSVVKETESLCGALGLTGETDDIASPAGGMRLAAILHDATKEVSPRYNLKLCKECGIILGCYDLESPSVIHGKSASGLAARDYGLSKPFCDAIFYHTTGRADMSVYEKILYIADYIEPTRTYAECKAARELFYKNASKNPSENEHLLDLTVQTALESTINSLRAVGKPVHPDSLAAAEWLESRGEK